MRTYKENVPSIETCGPELWGINKTNVSKIKAVDMTYWGSAGQKHNTTSAQRGHKRCNLIPLDTVVASRWLR